MAATRNGGLKCANTNKTKYGDNYYVVIGAIGGSKSRTGGFYKNKELARFAGTLGGVISRRGSVKLTPTERLKKRKEFEETYAHLLALHKRAKEERRLAKK